MRMIGEYRYSGTTINGQKYSIVRNDDELQRVSKVFDHLDAERIWDKSMPMTSEILAILKATE